MERVQVELDAPGFDRAGTVIRYGHWGRPVLVFPSEQGRAWDYENNGMVEAVRPLIDEGRVKLYCVDSFDHATWSDDWISLEERARRHGWYDAWVTGEVMGWIERDSPGATEALVTGCSMGAYHALNFALTRADLFPVAICQSGSYDPAQWHAWGERGEAAYFTNPTDYVPHLSGRHLDWLRGRVHVVLTVGQGPWEVNPTSSLPEAHRMAGLLAERGIPHELDVWGHDSAHDWDWWQRQIAVHLPRFC
jgi:esterase/lipase superfamily enzyme